MGDFCYTVGIFHLRTRQDNKCTNEEMLAPDFGIFQLFEHNRNMTSWRLAAPQSLQVSIRLKRASNGSWQPTAPSWLCRLPPRWQRQRLATLLEHSEDLSLLSWEETLLQTSEYTRRYGSSCRCVKLHICKEIQVRKYIHTSENACTHIYTHKGT